MSRGERIRVEKVPEQRGKRFPAVRELPAARPHRPDLRRKNTSTMKTLRSCDLISLRGMILHARYRRLAKRPARCSPTRRALLLLFSLLAAQGFSELLGARKLSPKYGSV